jgi:hypothetical protein
VTHSLKLSFSTHAIARYLERVRPSINSEHARWEMRQLAKVAEYSEQPPAWHPHPLDGPENATAWLVLADVAFALCGEGSKRVVVTVLTRGTIGPVLREARKQARVQRNRHREVARRRNVPKAPAKRRPVRETRA